MAPEPYVASFTSETAAWVAVVGALVALLKQGYDTWHNRKREKRQIEEALDRQPLVREQLELGNVGEAVKHLSVIIDQMAEDKVREDEQHAKELARAEERTRLLEDRLELEEAESERWRTRYRELETRCDSLSDTMRGILRALQKRGINLSDLGDLPPEVSTGNDPA